jgi:hypothetical protein
MTSFKQYDCVTIVALKKTATFTSDLFNFRQPQVGDVATIVEIYTNPKGYELECCNDKGLAEWLCSFDPKNIKLELINT